MSDYPFYRTDDDLPKRPDPRDYKNFTPRKIQRNWRAEQDADHRKKYPSLMERPILHKDDMAIIGRPPELLKDLIA